MGNLLSSLSKTIHASLALAIILFLGLFYQNDGFSFDRIFWSWVARYTHVVVGIMWIGLLWYLISFKFQIWEKFQMNKNQLSAKWCSSCTFLFQMGCSFYNTIRVDTCRTKWIFTRCYDIKYRIRYKTYSDWYWYVVSVIMAFNVWFVIWPNQRALGIVECDPELKAKSARTAMLFSRTNTLLSLPMLLSMVAAQNLY